MATRRVKLKGIAYWAKVFEDNRDLTGFEDSLVESGGQTSIDLDLTPDQMTLLKKSKSMKQGRTSPVDDNLVRVKLTRPWTKIINKRDGTGTVDLGGPPVVLKADGTAWDYDVDGVIGNGSEVEVVVSVFDVRGNRAGTRLEKVKVLVHNKYDPDAEDEDDIPAPQQKDKVAPKDIDDEIPF